MTLMRLLLATFSLAAVVVAQAGQGSPAVVQLIEKELAAARVPGAAIAVVSGDQVFAGAYGSADAERGVAMTPGTLMHSGSLTKLFTAMAVSATLEARNLRYEASVGEFMTGLAPRTGQATFHQLLSQTSGLRDRPGDTGSDDERALSAGARTLGPADFVLPGNVVFSYSNLGYSLAGAALESLSKRPFADVLNDAVLRPLGMTRSTLRPAEALARPHAVGHRLDGSSLAALRTPSNDTRIWPAGYLWTSATDMSRLLVALLDKGHVPGQRGLPSSVMTRITTEHVPMPNVLVGGHYGYGLMIARDRNTLVYEHGGTLPGFSSILRIAPERRLAVAILTNLDNAPLRRIAQGVMATALDLPALTPAKRLEAPVTAEELKPFLGRYVGRGTAQVSERDGQVVLSLDDGPPFAVRRIGENRFLARPKPDIAGPEFVLQPAANGAPAYLHFALWAYTKQ